jgi:hypothetical protein
MVEQKEWEEESRYSLEYSGKFCRRMLGSLRLLRKYHVCYF